MPNRANYEAGNWNSLFGIFKNVVTHHQEACSLSTRQRLLSRVWSPPLVLGKGSLILPLPLDSVLIAPPSTSERWHSDLVFGSWQVHPSAQCPGDPLSLSIPRTPPTQTCSLPRDASECPPFPDPLRKQSVHDSSSCSYQCLALCCIFG